MRYTLIPLPWWLGWKWVLRPLETLVILALAPRYNHAKNRWNPRRVSLSTQAMQRHERNCEPAWMKRQIVANRIKARALQAAGVFCILAGVIGAAITHR